MLASFVTTLEVKVLQETSKIHRDIDSRGLVVIETVLASSYPNLSIKTYDLSKVAY